jgi:hypothetical protein
MRAFLKLSLAAVAIALLASGSAFAGSLETGSDAKVTVSGWIGVNAHYTQLEEPIVVGDKGTEIGDAPPATLEVADRANLNIAATQGPITLHWELWQQEGCLTGCGNEQFGWVTWKVTDDFTIDAGQIEDPYWSELPVDWDTFVGPNSVASNGTGAVAFPEDTPGIDFTFKTGDIGVGVLWSASGQASGGRTGNINGAMKNLDCGTDAAPAPCSIPAGVGNNPAAGTQVNSFVLHATWSSDFMWIAALYAMESSQSFGLSGPTATKPGWNSYSDSAIRLSAKFNLGVGRLKVGYWTASGDTYDAQDAFFGGDTGGPGIDAPSDLAIGYHHFIGDSWAFIEYEMLANGSVDISEKYGIEATDATYIRVGYNMPIGPKSNLQFEYEMQDLGYSTRSAPGIAWTVGY